ncbi:MAG: thiamine-phosphate kinase [Vampirovibrionales bacterium]|nr:thiamine-phosphate kinase [Vampirovibrionales bacterium]
MATEAELIQSFLRFVGPPGNRLNDDAYLDYSLGQVLSTDLFIEGQHFDFNYYTPHEVGWKCLAGALSDIAAMGAKAQYALISLGLPSTIEAEDVQTFYEGIQACLNALGLPPIVCGGDTVRSPIWVINVTVTGLLRAVTHAGFRTGAQVGDWIVASGFHGLSAAGLWQFQQNGKKPLSPETDICRQAHLKPLPKLTLGEWFAEFMPRYSLMDSSDGLADALIKLSLASEVRFDVAANQIPLHPAMCQVAAQVGIAPINWALYGGEDYELVGTVPPNSTLPAGVVQLGVVSSGTGAWLHHPEGAVTEMTLSQTFQHFH